MTHRFLSLWHRPAPSRMPRRRRHAPRNTFRPGLESLESLLLPSVFTVTTTADSGPGSLRQAILDANATQGPNTIAFAIGQGGTQTIRPTSALPAITSPVLLDGTTQPGFAGAPLVVLDGSAAGPGTDGLTITAGQSTVRGLVVDDFHSDGSGGGNGLLLRGSGDLIVGDYIGTDVTGTIAANNGGYGVLIAGGASNNTIGGTTAAARNLISGNGTDVNPGGAGIGCFGTNNLIEGNYIGTDVTGTAALGNFLGVYIQVANNTIGGTTAGAGNLISGNIAGGVSINGGNNNLVLGNDIGADLTGTVALGNSGCGVDLQQEAGNTIGGTTAGARNLISGNGYAGVCLNGNGDLVQGNYIGTDSTGSAALGNNFAGIAFNNGNGNRIGGTTAGARNLISGNRGDGVWILSSINNDVQGNYIGTDSTGTAMLANGSNGVDIEDGKSNVIGGASAGAGNLIAGNQGDGVFIRPEYSTIGDSSYNAVEGNYIGTDLTGTAALGNAGDGVYIGPLCHDNTVGGTPNSAGNTIAFNGHDGVLVDSGTANSILRNSISRNTGLGIELVNGGNQMQPAPRVTSALSRNSPLTLQGALTSAPATTYTLEFFANTVDDPSGAGVQFLGSFTVTTDAGGTAAFTASLLVNVSAGQFVTATATDPDGNTSSFSPSDAVSSAPTVLNNHDRGPGSLRQALADANDGETIVFDAALAGQTITLTSGELVIDKSVAIAGPGAAQLTISGNSASRVFDILQSGLTVAIAGLTIADGVGTLRSPFHGPEGGAIYVSGGNMTLSSCILLDNQVMFNAGLARGGAIYIADGRLTVNGSTLSSNRAIGSNSVFGGRGFQGWGGALYVAGGSVQINDSTLANNQATGGMGGDSYRGSPGGAGGEGAGGAIYVAAGSLTVTNSTFAGNQVTGGDGGMGGQGTAGGDGGQALGGAINVAAGSATVTDSTFAANQATGGIGGMGQGGGHDGASGQGSGGGITNAGTLTLTGATVSGNAVGPSGSGGGLAALAAGTTTIRNAIIAANSASSSPDLAGTLNSLGHNLIGDGTGGSGFTDTDLVGTADAPIDPQLEPLGDYGGPTQTMRPLPSSPAVDAGDNSDAPPTDQRGFDRIVNGTIDIGAVELQPDELGMAPRLHRDGHASSEALEASRVVSALAADQLPLRLGGESLPLRVVSAGRPGSEQEGKPVDRHPRDAFFQQFGEDQVRRDRDGRPAVVLRAEDPGVACGLIRGGDWTQELAALLS